MTVFNAYARYYDLVNRDKDYAREARYVSGLIGKMRPGAKRVLELGCGTGLHAIELAKLGLAVDGVDASHDMLELARARLATVSPELAHSISFVHGDARTYTSDERYDAVISLFHVASYQTTEEDISNYIDTAVNHLVDGGVFAFDFWYGPAVLSDRPTVRVKRFEDQVTKITRISEPKLLVNRNLVEVNFDIHIEDFVANSHSTILEQHLMRYFFLPELDVALGRAGFKHWRAEEWISGNEPGDDTWGVCITAVK